MNNTIHTKIRLYVAQKLLWVGRGSIQPSPYFLNAGWSQGPIDSLLVFDANQLE